VLEQKQNNKALAPAIVK